VAITTTPRKMTADEFFALGDELPPVTQLIDGALVMSTPSLRHQRVVAWLIYRFMSFAEARPGVGEMCIEVSTVIDEHNVYAPDVWWMPEERRLAGDERRLLTPPPLVAEVRSPSTWRYDVGTKLRHYEAAGVSEVWLIDTDAAVVLVFRRSSPEAASFDLSLELTTADDLSTPLIPGWSVGLAELFAR